MKPNTLAIRALNPRMDSIRELLTNAQAVHHLQRRYYWLTTTVGLIAVAVGILMQLFVANLLATWLGMTWSDRVEESTNGGVWLALFFLSIPLVFYVSAVIVAWLSTFPMRWFGVMAAQDVKFYVLRSRYPEHWFKD